MKKKTKVLVVEDSAVAREFLVYVLGSDPEISVVGTAKNGEEAVTAAKHLKPDIITMDIHMPAMNGFEATRKIMETCPVPILIVSGSSSAEEVATTFRAIEAGALSVVPRPRGMGHPGHEETIKELIQQVKLMAEVKVVRRWPRQRKKSISSPVLLQPEAKLYETRQEIKLIAIGSSTGGPLALQTILSRLPSDFPVPVLIVQHIAAGFLTGLVEWLSETSTLPLRIASNGELAQPGHAYFAPDDFHMRLQDNHVLLLSKDPPENGMRPSVSHLFRSAAETFGARAAGILLTGMGKDGAAELKLMKEKGAMTVAQDEESAVVHGMPGEAIKLDGVTYVLSPDKIANMLQSLSQRRE